MWSSGSNEVFGFEWFIVGLAFVVDLGSYVGGEPGRARLSPQRQLQLEARVGVVELVAEQLAQPRQPVARRLRVEAERARHGGGVAALAHVGERRLRHALARLRGELVEVARAGARRCARPARGPRTAAGRRARRRRAADRRAAAITPASAARSAARASAHERPARPPATAGPSAARRPPARRAISAARPGPSGSGITAQPVALERAPTSASAGRRRAIRSSSLLGARQRRGRAREAPAGRRGRRPHVGLVRGRVAQQQHDQLALAPAALALEPRARLGVALHRVGRQLLDVGEDRLGQQAQHLGVDVRPARRVGHPPPGDPGARPGRRTAASRACGPGAARRARAPRTPRGPVRARPRGCGSARRTGAAPR